MPGVVKWSQVGGISGPIKPKGMIQMLKVIMGHKGTGKTKDIIDLVKKAAEEENGAIVCMEKGDALKYDIPYSVRLVEAPSECTGNVEFLKGMICGMLASNYDLSHIFMDGLLRIVGELSDVNLEKFLDWTDKFSDKNNVKVTITISSDADLASAGVKKYC